MEGTIVVVLGEELDEELEDEELDEPAGITHGGTMSVETLEFEGTVSWLVGVAPEACWACAPPGVTSTVLAAGGETAPLDEDDELEEEEEEGGGWHGWIATVCVTVPLGITMVFEPGGGPSSPVCVWAATEHGGTAIVSGLLRAGICTVRTPGFMRAVETGSMLEELELLLLLPPPQAASPVASVALIMRPATRVAAGLALVVMLLLRGPLQRIVPAFVVGVCAPGDRSPASPTPRGFRRNGTGRGSGTRVEIFALCARRVRRGGEI